MIAGAELADEMTDQNAGAGLVLERVWLDPDAHRSGDVRGKATCAMSWSYPSLECAVVDASTTPGRFCCTHCLRVGAPHVAARGRHPPGPAPTHAVAHLARGQQRASAGRKPAGDHRCRTADAPRGIRGHRLPLRRPGEPLQPHLRLLLGDLAN